MHREDHEDAILHEERPYSNSEARVHPLSLHTASWADKEVSNCANACGDNLLCCCPTCLHSHIPVHTIRTPFAHVNKRTNQTEPGIRRHSRGGIAVVNFSVSESLCHREQKGRHVVITKSSTRSNTGTFCFCSHVLWGYVWLRVVAVS